MTPQYISNILLNDNDTVTKYGNVMSQKLSQKKYPNIYNYVTYWGRQHNCESYKETIVRMKYNIIERPTCKICGGHIRFNKQKRVNGTFFPTYCSHSCQMKDPEQQAKHNNTCVEKYGSSNNIKRVLRHDNTSMVIHSLITSKNAMQQTQKDMGVYVHCKMMI